MASLTIEQIAELAHISRSTVSRVLNNHPNVRPAVRNRVLQVIQEHGYSPQAAARSLASRRTKVIGLLIPHSASLIFSDPFFGHVVHSVTEEAAQHGYFLMLAMVTAEREQGFYDRILRSRHFDGMIMLSSDIDDPILPQILKDKLPLVLIGSHPYFLDVTWVDVEHRVGARQAVEHLRSLGHQRIATITGPLSMQAALDRRDGYKQGLLENGLPVRNEYIVVADWTQQGGFNAMQQLLSVPERPTAVFIASDTMATGAMRALSEAGLSVPDDIAIVSFDDLPVASYAHPPLTTIRQPITEMGATAVKLLIKQFEHQDTSVVQVRLPIQLMIRSSCGALARTTQPMAEP